jgi:hypothetical protein
MSTNTPPIHNHGNISTLFEKLDPSRRKKIDACILNRQPASIRAIHEKFHLTDAGISYHVLYRYARSLRDEQSTDILDENVLAGRVDLPAKIPELLACRLTELLLHEDPSELAIQRLTNAYTKSLQLKAVIARAAAIVEVPNPKSASLSWHDRNKDGSPLTEEQRLYNLNKLANRIFGVSLPGMGKDADNKSDQGPVKNGPGECTT